MKGLLLLSGGIDSPVAGYLMMKKMDLEAVYFDNSVPSNLDSLKRTKQNAKKIGLKKLHVVSHAEALSSFSGKCDRKFLCVFCKRMMLRSASALAGKIGAECLVNGDNLAQVASQTLQNLKTVSNATSLPIIRPLIGMDKNEIIKIAKEIGTFNISTQPVACCPLTPLKPSTMASLSKIESEETKIKVDFLVSKALKDRKELRL